jgi:hypothetical protein
MQGILKATIVLQPVWNLHLALVPTLGVDLAIHLLLQKQPLPTQWRGQVSLQKHQFSIPPDVYSLFQSV